MDSQFFEEWVREQDRKFESEGRKVALEVDNCPAHPDVADLRGINLVFFTTKYYMQDPTYGPRCHKGNEGILPCVCGEKAY